MPPTDQQAAAAEGLVESAFDRSQWDVVLGLGPRLAQLFATRGAFGAWGRVLMFVANAAEYADDPAARNLARHELAVRARLLADDESTPGSAFAVASVAQPPLPDRVASDRRPAAFGIDRRPLAVRTMALLGLGLLAVACLTVFFWPRPAPSGAIAAFAISPVSVLPRQPVTLPVAPQISAFSAQPSRITVGESIRLCYAVRGANLLRIVPRVGELGLLRACRTITPADPHAYIYKLFAIAGNGKITVREARFSVVAVASPAPPASPIPTASAVAAAPSSAQTADHAADDALARRAVYQFDVTPDVVERGQVASLCVGIGRWATGNVTTIGALPPGITRCYRVRPAATTVYQLHVALDRSVAVESVTVAVHRAARVHQVAHNERR